MINETLKIANLYVKLNNWNEVFKEDLEQNLLQKLKISSSKRQLREIRFRLQNLSVECLSYLLQANPDDQKAIILLAILKTYLFIFEFILEVLKPKLDVYDTILRDSDYLIFFENKASIHPELAALSDSTKAKIKQVLYRILAEAGLLDSVKSKNIQRPNVSSSIVELIRQDDPKWLKAFLHDF